MTSPFSQTVLAAGASVAAAVRPHFVIGTVVSLGFGFVMLHREERRACEPDTLCASPVARRRMKRALWVATVRPLDERRAAGFEQLAAERSRGGPERRSGPLHNQQIARPARPGEPHRHDSPIPRQDRVTRH